MLVTGRAVRAVVAAAAAVVSFAACTSSGKKPDAAPRGANLDAAAMRTALLQPEDVGSTWKAPAGARPAQLVALCAGAEAPPPVPGAPSVVSVPLVDQGDKGAQTLDQVALVYADADEAAGGLTALRVSADACADTVDVPPVETDERSEPAYTETARVAPLTVGQWTGFVVERHKAYQAARPAATDTAVAVLSMRNVVLVDAYGVYVLAAKGPAPNFATDWRKLVTSAVNRVAG